MSNVIPWSGAPGHDGRRPPEVGDRIVAPATHEPHEDVLDDMPRARRVIDVVPGRGVDIRAGTMSAGDFGMYVGEDGVLKSTIALHLCGATAGGYRFLGRFETTQASTLIISEEDQDSVLRNRLEAQCRGHHWDPDIVLSNLHVLATAGVDLTSPTWLAHIRREVERIRPGIIVFDPWAELISGDENSNTDARPVIKAMRALTSINGANVIVVAHLGKPVEGRKMADLIRGASATRRASRFTYGFEHDDAAHEVKVTCLKMSRCEKLPPFVIRYSIDADPSNPAVWRSARFDYVTAQTAMLDRAEQFIADQLAAGERMNTTQLKAAAKGTRVSGADLSRAIKSMEMRRLIDFVGGAKGAKEWGLRWLPTNSRQPGQPENQLAGQPECLPGNHSEGAFCLPASLEASSNRPGLRQSGNHDGREWPEPDESQSFVFADDQPDDSLAVFEK